MSSELGLEQHYRDVEQADSIEDVRQILDTADGLAANQPGFLAAITSLRVVALDKMRSLTEVDVSTAERIIVRYLLPLVTRPLSEANNDEPIIQYRYRELLSGWVNQYSGSERRDLRNHILEELRRKLIDPTIESACWAIGSLGYRDPSIWDDLRTIALIRADSVGDTAFATMTALGVLPASDVMLQSVLTDRLQQRLTPTLLTAAANWGDLSVAETIYHTWLIPRKAPDAFLALHALVDIGTRHRSPESTQQTIWEWIKSLFDKSPVETSGMVFFSSALAPRLDLAGVVSTLLTWLGGEGFESPLFAQQRFLIYNRLEECVQPTQLAGWGQPLAESTLLALKQDALADTKFAGRAPTSEGYLKQWAWDCLLRQPEEQVLSWLETALSGETNDFIQLNLCQKFACFRLEPLPPSIADWITDSYVWNGESDQIGWAVRLGATQLARSAASLQAFELLLRFGFTLKGNVLQQTADALAEVALVVARDQPRIVQELVDVATQGLEHRHRSCALNALLILSSHDLVPTESARALGISSSINRDE